MSHVQGFGASPQAQELAKTQKTKSPKLLLASTPSNRKGLHNCDSLTLSQGVSGYTNFLLGRFHVFKTLRHLSSGLFREISHGEPQLTSSEGPFAYNLLPKASQVTPVRVLLLAR